MKYLSICSGIEAATVAWHGFGWEPVAFSEIEPFPSAVLAHHYPNVPNLGDMTKFAEWPEAILAECDILVGGPPCQAFSVAGLRRSLDDDRGNITLAYVRLLDHIDSIRRKHGRSPAIAVYENVPGLLSTKDNAFGCLIGALAGCDEAPETETGKWPKAGFFSGEARRVGYRILDAQYFGVAQRRRRIFLVAVPCEVVASLGERACPSEILSLRESLLGNPPARGAAWEGVARATTSGLTSSGRGVERPGESRGQGDVVLGIPDPSYSISAGQQGKGGHYQPKVAVAFTKSKRAQSNTDDESWVPGDVAPTQNQFDCGETRATTVVAFAPLQGGRSMPVTPEAPTLKAGTGNKIPAICFTQNTRDEVRQINGDGQIAGALAAEAGMKQTNYIAFAQNQLGEVRVNDGVMGTVNTNQNASGRNTPMIAFANRTRDGIKVPEVMKDEVVPALTNPGGGGRADAVNVAAAMQVRRLSPTECERLQGFPDNYTLITFRKKPAADGPRYRALGNSMAVPCMWWIGSRIHKATHGDIQCH